MLRVSLAPGEMWIGDLAREAGLSTATINFYVQEGIIPPARKISRTRAAYGLLHLRALRVVRRTQIVTGMPLAQIKRMWQVYGLDEEGIAKAESIGALQPLPAAYGDPPDATIDHFEPVALGAFAKRTGATRAFIQELEALGLLRPRRAKRYDAYDAWLVKTVHALVEDGVALDWLRYNVALLPMLRDMARVVDHLVWHHVDALRDRRLRFRDLQAPLTGIIEHLFYRLHEEENPRWREAFTDPRARSPAKKKRRQSVSR